MNYLNREQRRDMILAAAKTLALKEGLNALTVRAIATQAQVSTGQVHHHFQSASHLKAQVFIELMDQLNEVEAQVQTDSWLRRISLILGCENIEQTQPYLRLWNEAEILIEHDIEIKKAYNLTMERWHSLLVNFIENGIQLKQFKIKKTTNAQDVAWRLIAFVCGLEGIYQLGLKGLDQPSFQRHVEIMIKMELMNSV